MDCREVHQGYGFYLQSKLSPVQMDFIDQHIKDCPDCFLFCKEYRESFLAKILQPEDYLNKDQETEK
jgi:hypothetical protein